MYQLTVSLPSFINKNALGVKEKSCCITGCLSKLFAPIKGCFSCCTGSVKLVIAFIVIIVVLTMLMAILKKGKKIKKIVTEDKHVSKKKSRSNDNNDYGLRDGDSF